MTRMHQVKLFKSVENEVHGLEAEVNTWLKQSGARVLQITGNIAPQTPPGDHDGKLGQGYAPSDLFVMVLYEA